MKILKGFQMIEIMIQSIIFICGVAYMWLLSCKKDKYRIAGFCIIICVQPLWIYVTLMSGQYGMLTLSVIYFFTGLRGLYTHWWKPKRKIITEEMQKYLYDRHEKYFKEKENDTMS